MFVFKPSEPRPLYVQRNICSEEVRWGVFVPRDVPDAFTSEALQWLNRSQFYFLTASQVTVLLLLQRLPRDSAAVLRGGIVGRDRCLVLWEDCSRGKVSGVFRQRCSLCRARLGDRPSDSWVDAHGSARTAGLAVAR